MEVEDAKRLVRDAIAARIFNDMVSLERKSSNDISSPFPPPYAKIITRNNHKKLTSKLDANYKIDKCTQ